MQVCSITDRGKIRQKNEDSFRTMQIGDFTVLVLADGMGGHSGGEVASKSTVEHICAYLEENLESALIPARIFSIMSDAIENAGRAVYELSKTDAALSGMGTTLELCIIAEDTAYIAHIGDSRVYKIRGGKEISLLTKDHSLVSYMIETGAITPEEAVNHPQKNVITRALGTTLVPEADIFSVALRKDDILLLCSDGLSNMLNEETILKVTSKGTLEKCAQKLVSLANKAGGTDNITAILSQY